MSKKQNVLIVDVYQFYEKPSFINGVRNKSEYFYFILILIPCILELTNKMHWVLYFFIFLLRWLLHVSAKRCHSQGATMFLSEPLQRQYGRKQVIGHMTEPTYRRSNRKKKNKEV
jgi:hypothetical protein